MTEAWFRIDKMSILTDGILLWSITKWLLNWNIMMKKFLSWISAFSSLDRWCTVLLIWTMSFCNDLSSSLFVSVSRYVQLMKLKVFCIWLLKVSLFPLNISILFLIAVISSALLEVLNKKLNREWIIPLLVWFCFEWPRVVASQLEHNDEKVPIMNKCFQLFR